MGQKIESLKGKVGGVGEAIDERLVCFMNSFLKKYKTGIDFKEKISDKILFNIAIGLARIEKFKKAERIIEKIKDDYCKKEVISFFLFFMIKKGVKMGYFEDVFKIVEDMQNGFLKEKALKEIIEKMVKNSSRKKILKIIKSIDNIFFRERVKGEIAIELEQYGLSVKAYEIVNTIEFPSVKEKVLEKMNKIFFKRVDNICERIKLWED